MLKRKRTARSVCQILSQKCKRIFQYKTCFLLKSNEGDFVEGLLVESTSYKDTFYVWSVICPTWHLVSEPKLDYGNRLLDGSYFVGNAIEISDKIVEAVRVDDVARRRCCGPPTQVAEFFSTTESGVVRIMEVDVETHNNLGHIFDKVVLLLLSGYIRGGYAALDAYNCRGNGRGKYASVATDLRAALKVGDGSWLGVVEGAQRRGREAMGLTNRNILKEDFET